MKIQRFMTWPLAATLVGVAGLIIVALAPPTAEASFQLPETDIQCVNKTVTPSLVDENSSGSLTYVVSVKNNGPFPAENVIVTDTLPTEGTLSNFSATPSAGSCGAPAGNILTCNLGTLGPGVTETVTIDFDFTNVLLTDTYRNFASVTTSTTETDATNNGGAGTSCDVFVNVRAVGEPILVCLGKTAVPTTLDDGVGANIVYTVLIQNQGDAPAENVSVKDTLLVIAANDPTFESSTVNGGNTNCGGFSLNDPLPNNTMITCPVPNLAANAFATVVVTVKVANPVFGEIFGNSAVAMADGPISSNVCSAVVTVNQPPGGDGCTPGFWKNHLDLWGPTGFATGDIFDTVFGVTLFGGSFTLEDAINAKGGGKKKLARHGTAALLSAGHPGVASPFTVNQVIALVQAGDVDPLVDANELGCPIN